MTLTSQPFLLIELKEIRRTNWYITYIELYSGEQLLAFKESVISIWPFSWLVLTTLFPIHVNRDHTGGIMVSMLTSSVADCEF